MRNETKGYIKYHIKRSLKPFLFILTVALVVILVTCSTDRVISYSYDNVRWETEYYLQLYIPAIIAAVVAYFQVSAQLSPFKKRRNLDCYYSLPISRRTLGVIHFLTGLTITVLVYTASFALNLILYAASAWEYPADHRYILLLPYYFASVLMICAVYSVLAFAYDRGNTAGDGRWMMALYTFAPAMLSGAVIEIVVNKILDRYYYGDMSGILPVSLVNQAELVEKTILGNALKSETAAAGICWFVGLLVLGSLAAVGFVILVGQRGTQKVEELSDSPFAYKTLIPYFVVLGACNFYSMALVALAIIGVLAVVGYVVYRRGFRLKKQDVISWLLSMLAAVVITAVLD